MVSQRKCSVRDCSNNYATHTLFSFPKVDLKGFKGDNPLFHKGLRRCLYWIQRSGNVTLLKEHPEKLKSRHFMCSDHFNDVYFSGKGRRTLRINAFPDIFAHNGIGDMDMQKYMNWISASDKSDSPFSSVQRTVNYTADQPKTKKQARRKCKVPNCQMTQESTMFAFPRPSYLTYPGAPYDTQTYIRCKAWLQAVGNESLLAFSPLDLWRHAFICTAHFEDHHFHSKMKRKLLQTAVPLRFLPAPLSDNQMEEYNKLYP